MFEQVQDHYLLFAAAYLLGAVPFSQIVARLHGVDLRLVGSGNVGASNLGHQVGWGWGILVAILDGLKGLVPVWIARQAGLDLGVSALAGMAAVVGHSWSILLRSRSGRGLATSAGLVIGLDPYLLLWTASWAVAGWKIGGGIAGFIGWAPLFLVAMFLGREPGEVAILAVLSVVLLSRRMQGNRGDPPGLRQALRRAVFDADLAGSESLKSADEPLTS
jgi:glycerol-3-phosphate acyltransferase PlsY